jgi:hypothetical protein
MLARTLVLSSVAAILASAQSQVPLQPLAQQVRRLEDALNYLGQPLAPETHDALNQAMALSNETAAVARIQELLDPLVLAEIEINAESRVKVTQGAAKPELVEGGTRLFLVKVNNLAAVTAPLVVESPNSGPVYLQSRGEHAPALELTMADVQSRWGSFEIFTKPPMRPRLTGLAVEYAVMEAYSRDAGQRSALLAFNVGQGTQDIGFRNDIMVLFTAAPARDITLRVKNENGERTMASFVVRDRQGRLYPNPAKRLEPDFPFQPQVYRYDGERLRLPDGYYTIQYSGGPEYYTRTKELPVSENGPRELEFQLQRWIDPSKYGWWSGDHHVHAAGCAHYKNPTEGVEPEAMMRQALGENLNISSVLTWGPSWYHQKKYFSGTDHQLSKTDRLMHYDVEVSGFPSAHSGHLILLGLKEDDYPGTTKIEEWPTWDLPVLKWGKSQDAITGFSHSGWGLEVRTDELPNYEMPGFDGIGANEYVVDVTHPDTIDFISTVDTPAIWELNVWYHTLNVGFRTRVSGETDFPCIYQEKVGLGRSYVKLDDLSYRGWIEGVRRGATYVSDGKSHLIDFKVNGMGIDENDAELKLSEPGKAKVTMKVAAMLPEQADPKFATLRYDQKPYWDVERARVEGEREVAVEIIVNGKPVATKNVLADGQVRDVEIEIPIERSSWVAARILYSSHTNPMFVEVGGKPVRASRRSAEWLLAAVNQCWTQKAPRIRESEIEDARKAYDHAREVYKQRMAESEVYE